MTIIEICKIYFYNHIYYQINNNIHIYLTIIKCKKINNLYKNFIN